MRLQTADLLDLIGRGARRATGDERNAADTAARDVADARRTADLNSRASRWLQGLPDRFAEHLRPEALEALQRVEIYGVESAYPNATVTDDGFARRIFVFDGLLHCIFFAISLIRVLSSLQLQRPDARYDLGGEMVPEPLAFSSAGFSILSDAIGRQRSPAAIDGMLDPQVREEARSAYGLAALFVLLHEVAHLELGHCALDGVRAEREHLDLVEPEFLSAYQADEMAADRFALELVKPEHRAELVPSLIFFFLPFAFLEAFSGGLSSTHPLSINRLAALAASALMDERDRDIVVRWIEGQVGRMQDLADDRAALGPRLRRRIEENMPVAQAYRIIEEIRVRATTHAGRLQGV